MHGHLAVVELLAFGQVAVGHHVGGLFLRVVAFGPVGPSLRGAVLCPYLVCVFGYGLLQFGQVVEGDGRRFVDEAVGGVGHHQIVVRLAPGLEERCGGVGGEFLVGVGIEECYLLFVGREGADGYSVVGVLFLGDGWVGQQRVVDDGDELVASVEQSGHIVDG